MWPPRVCSPCFCTAAEATRAAWADRAHDPSGSYEVVEFIAPGDVPGVAIVRPVIRVLGGFGRGDAYEAEYWG